MKGLTPKQQRFVEEYLVDLNATQAAIRAGYSAKTANEQGSQLLVKLSITEAIAAAKAKRSEKTEITAEWVLGRLFENVERAMQNQPVKDREGNETGEYTYEGSVANRALELLGKHVGLFGDKLTLSGDQANPLRVSMPELLNDSNYLTYLRDRAGFTNGYARSVRAGGKPGAVAPGAASGPAGPGTNGHSHH